MLVPLGAWRRFSEAGARQHNDGSLIMRIKPIAAAIAAGTVLGFSAPGAFAQLPPTNPISFDADGQGGVNSAREVQTFDWAVSSLLSVPGPCPSNPDGTLQVGCKAQIPIFELTDPTYLKSLTHAALHGFQDSAGDPVGAPAGLNTTFELTFVAGACTKAVPAGSVLFPNGITAPRSLNLSLNPSAGCLANGGDPGQFFEIWYDDLTDGVGTQSDALAGTGYRDGKLILSGSVVNLTGTAAFTDPVIVDALFDQFGADNYTGTKTVILSGSTSIVVQVDQVDEDFFKSGVDHGSLLPFTGEVRLPYRETNPSANFYSGEIPGPDPLSVGTTTDIPADVVATIGTENGISGPHLEQQADASNSFVFLPPEQACRVTGGGNDTAGLNATLDGWDGTVATDQLTPSIRLKPRGKKTSLVTPDYFYSFGGQAGANTALQPQPKGQWEHNNHSSPTGMTFAFHGGKNAPAGTQIDEIRCTDPGWCVQARPAPDKQIDFVGIGTFSNISGNTFSVSDGVVFNGIQNVIPEPKTNAPGGTVPTYHWFQVHIEDLGEPGSQANEPGATCPPKGSGNDPFANPAVTGNIADCGCADFYRITIYQGVQPALDANGDVILDPTGDIPGIDKEHKIYEVFGYINGGNFQIHPLTGFDLK